MFVRSQFTSDKCPASAEAIAPHFCTDARTDPSSVALGDTGAAFDLLERLLPHANHETKAWIKHDSDFDPLRQQPRYQKILELVGK